MAHAFDTGLAKPQRALIRDALVARLGALKRVAPGTLYAGTVEGIPSPLRGDDDQDYVKGVVGGQFPALLVALGRKKYEAAGMCDQRDQYMGTLDLFVYAVSDHQRSPDLARVAGDAASAASNQKDPGIETMLEHVEELLLGYQVTDASLTVYQVRPVEERELFHDVAITVWEQQYQVAVQRDLKRNKAIADVLETISTSSNLHDGGDQNPVAQPLTNIPI